MKKLTSIGLLFFTVLYFSSCSSTSYYLPAITGNNVSYMPKPMGSDSVKVGNYISGSIGSLSLPYSTGNLDMGLINFNRAHTFKNVTIAYGAFGFAGSTTDYHDQANAPAATAAFDGKGFIGGGLRSSIGLYDESGNAEFRILSWENALSFESGGYSDFRNAMYNLHNPDIISSTKTTLFTTGGASEIIWHSKKRQYNQFAFKLFYGVTPGLKSSLRRSLNDDYYVNKGGAFTLSFYFKLNKFFGTVDTGGERGSAGKFSLGYAF